MIFRVGSNNSLQMTVRTGLLSKLAEADGWGISLHPELSRSVGPDKGE